LSFLDSLEGSAGQRWFREYVADPIPNHIHNIRGGYSAEDGSSIMLTLFDYEPPLERPPFPAGWELGNQVAASLLANLVGSYTGVRLSISRGYIKPLNPSGGASAWLLLDEGANIGVLYEAAYNQRDT
jgi:hypothetical protein